MNQRVFLEGGCHVSTPQQLPFQQHGSLRWSQVIGIGDAARKLSMFLLEPGAERSPGIACGEAEAVLFVTAGTCEVQIGDRRFEASSGCGVHVRTAECFALRATRAPARLLAAVCPRVEGLSFPGQLAPRFDDGHPQRVVDGARQAQHASSDRYYKLLVGPATGSDRVTQFIGRIPPSKAPEHYHLYEEAICILSGSGRMWTGEASAPVGPGSMIFLPREQRHCLECQDPSGMELVGMFYPAGSPAVNYR